MHHVIDLHLETGPWYLNKRTCAAMHNTPKASSKPGAETCSQTHMTLPETDADKN